ncbi:MAG TPA: DUF4345 domain-containing protein [Tahibacter sp.]|uniref:DUF4345 domain-containing protein n=1 Tax=Tahibacter sp. TaxID=2056211 RepID=UPI002CA088D1|nr:DUF4345 domain-containing protein [Tahibacter sp.]HSX62180.1 DUF4345 domain-containing protein [Tahibacter sp.]
MITAYLVVNAVVYALLGAASAIVPERIATAVGLTLDAQGRVEFLTVYAGLELGLAAFYGWAATAGAAAQRTAVVFSLFLYAGLVLFRAGGMLRYGVPGTTMLVVAGLEVLLLAGALVLALRAG